MLSADLDETWYLAVAYLTSSRAVFASRVLRAMLPVLARIWLRCFRLAKSKTLMLLRLLGPGEYEDEGKQSVARDFASLRSCCTPSGVKALRDTVTHSSDCFTPEFLDVVRELRDQAGWLTIPTGQLSSLFLGEFWGQLEN